jgi:DNA-binding response OmpR family regulator
MNKKVLVIDDDVSYLSIVEHLLASRQIDHKICRDAKDGRGLIESYAPDVLLLDWMMPGISGLDLLKTIREEMKNRDLFIIMITAKMYSDDIVTAFATGADDYIIKPFPVKELIARIENGARIKRSREFNTKNKQQLTGDLDQLSVLLQKLLDSAVQEQAAVLQQCRGLIASMKEVVHSSDE